jgi:hypothetical protein
VAIAAEDALAVLVRQDEQEVGGLHESVQNPDLREKRYSMMSASSMPRGRS